MNIYIYVYMHACTFFSPLCGRIADRRVCMGLPGPDKPDDDNNNSHRHRHTHHHNNIMMTMMIGDE